MKLDYHISSVCKSVLFHMRDIGDICSILSNIIVLHYVIYVI